MKKTLFIALLWAHTCFAHAEDLPSPVELVQGLDIQAERSEIAKERKLSDDAFKATLKQCYQKIAVNACKEEAQQIKFQKENDLRRRELVLNEAERKDRSAKALKSAQEKQSTDKLSQDEERRRDAQEQHLEKVQNNLDKKEQRLQKEAEMAANREARAKQLEEVQERQRSHDAKLKEAARNQEVHQRKLQDAEQHRAQLEKDRANRKSTVQPLPPRTETTP